MDAEILVATRNIAVFEVLEQRNIAYRAGLYSDEIAGALSTARVVIIDDADVVELRYGLPALRGMLEQQGIMHGSSEQFLQSPDEFLRVLENQGERGSPIPPQRTIAFISYSGGTGKTTLALDTALRFAQVMQRNIKLPVLLVELTHGVSALSALTGMPMPTLFDLVTEVEDVEPTRHRGVTMIPMDYDTARDLSVDMVQRFLRQHSSAHALTVIDSHYPHGFIPAIQDLVDRWLVVTTPRVDAVANAEKLRAQLGPKAAIVLNQKGGLVDSLALSGLNKDLELPRIGHPETFEGRKLGEGVLRYLYGRQAWMKRYSRPKSWWRRFLGQPA